ncbi:MAG: RHS repeat-associated core domain-containing protein [Myxococcales bacterium]|nr:RHS repeat-associated core domain-containing protein [Myxococcales bacterium]
MLFAYQVSGNSQPKASIYRIGDPKTAGPYAEGESWRIPSEDGTEVYIFDQQGRHLETRDAVTGRTQLRFETEPSGGLMRVVDAFGRATQFVESEVGVDVLSPADPLLGERRTELTLDPASGFLTRVRHVDALDAAAGLEWAMSYSTGDVCYATVGEVATCTPPGLLDRFAGPGRTEAESKRFHYDSQGRLTADVDPLAETTELERYELWRWDAGCGGTCSVWVNPESLPEGDVWTWLEPADTPCEMPPGPRGYAVRKLSAGAETLLTVERVCEGVRRTVTHPSGLQTITTHFDDGTVVAEDGVGNITSLDTAASDRWGPLVEVPVAQRTWLAGTPTDGDASVETKYTFSWHVEGGATFTPGQDPWSVTQGTVTQEVKEADGTTRVRTSQWELDADAQETVFSQTVELAEREDGVPTPERASTTVLEWVGADAMRPVRSSVGTLSETVYGYDDAGGRPWLRTVIGRSLPGSQVIEQRLETIFDPNGAHGPTLTSLVDHELQSAGAAADRPIVGVEVVDGLGRTVRSELGAEAVTTVALQSYDALGRRVAVTVPGEAGHQKVHQFAYNDAGLQVRACLPSVDPTDPSLACDDNHPSALTAHLDAEHGRPEQFVLPEQAGALAFVYDGAGRIEQTTFGGAMAGAAGVEYATGAGEFWVQRLFFGHDDRPTVEYALEDQALSATRWVRLHDVGGPAKDRDPQPQTGTLLGGVEAARTARGLPTDITLHEGGHPVASGFAIALDLVHGLDDELQTVTVDGGATTLQLQRDGADDAGLLVRLTSGVVETEWTYDAHGRVAIERSYRLDAAGCSPTDCPGGTVCRFDLGAVPRCELYRQDYTQRYADGRLRSLAEDVGGEAATTDFVYDTLGRLVAAGAETFAYDPNGNRLDDALGLQSVFDGRDRLVWSARTGDHFAYDGAGRLSERCTGAPCGDPQSVTAWRYTYDALGNLVEAEAPNGDVVEYIIGPGGQRVGRRVVPPGGGGVGWRYLIYGEPLRPYAEVDEFGVLQSVFVYAQGGTTPDLIYTRAGAGFEALRVLTDHVGSVRLLVRASDGEVVRRYEYDVWGHRVVDSSADGYANFSQPFGFAGGLHDEATGLVRFGLRDYDPRLGRWTAPDPLGFGGGDFNLYAYAGNDPVNFVDPTGLFPCGSFVMLGQLLGGLLSVADLFHAITAAANGDLWGAAGHLAMGLPWGRVLKGTGALLGAAGLIRINLRGPQNLLQLAISKVPGAWGSAVRTRKGVGLRWFGAKGDSIRIDRGVRRSPFPAQRVDHVVINRGGRIIGPDGVPIQGALKANPQAHIPLADWVNWTHWYSP